MVKQLCSKCGRRKPTKGRRQCEHCLSVARAANSRRRQEKKEQKLCYDCQQPATPGYTRCDTCRAAANQRAAEYSSELKQAVMEHYGGAVCACCGEDNLIMLTMDHIDQNGGDHRRELGHELSAGQKFYQWLRRNKYPKGYRVLCRNCNYAVYHSIDHCCPHRRGVFAGG